MDNELEKYWRSIPVGKENAATYPELMCKWGMSNRAVRKMLAELSAYDNGDDLILIRSSGHKGFYRTNDRHDIVAYKFECRGRALKTFAPLKKINRVCRIAAEENYRFFNNMRIRRVERGLKQSEVCCQLGLRGVVIDVSMLSRLESGYALPTPALLSALADILSCEPCELVAIERDSLELYASHNGLQAVF